MLSKERISKYPQWIKNICKYLTREKIPASLVFLAISLFATIWFLIRVIPKPNRVLYPCMRTVAPIISGFLIWTISVTGSLVAFRKAKAWLIHKKYFAGIGLSLAGIAFFILFFINNPRSLKAGITPWYKPNSPVGQAKGIFSGRVVWAHNPDVAKWDGITGYWWEDQYSNQTETDKLVHDALITLTNAIDEKHAWNDLFTYFNETQRGVSDGYRNNEKIAIKINQNNTKGHGNTNEINTSPQLVLSTLSSLINQANVPEENIIVFDASRFITDNVYYKCHSVFPGVIFVDNAGGDGRLKSTYVKDAIPYSVDNGKLARDLASCVVEAAYVINIAILKGHVGQGVTLCAKNYYGATNIFPDWRKNAHDNFNQNRDGSPKYMTFTDFMGHKDLGEKTILFMLDAIYTNKFVEGPPSFKWQMIPFNNNWPSSLFVSQDGIALDAVGMDFILAEWPDAPDLAYCDMYLLEAALADNPPSRILYDPERDGKGLRSLGVMEHWNNMIDKKYSKNLNTGNGIELVYVSDEHEKIYDYPETQITNEMVRMKLYLPDPENGYYRGTRFEWSGIVSSLEYKGHQYFGEWKSTHDPFFHEDLCGPVEASINPGLGYTDAKTGEKFIRIGVGVLEKPDEQEYHWNQTYKIIDHGKWSTTQGADWIEFTHELNSDIGYSYIYIKRIELKKDEPGFAIIHTLRNTGSKIIETDQFNHNFFVIDGQITGPDFIVQFPFAVRTDNDLKDLMKIEDNKLLFTKQLNEGSIWLLVQGYGTGKNDHNIIVKNEKTGAGVQYQVDKPLSRLAFWATTTTLCPENFINISLDPGKEEKWVSDYTLFILEK